MSTGGTPVPLPGAEPDAPGDSASGNSATGDSPPADAPPRLPGAVWVLGAVSFFVDLSSELLYPVLPLFLAALGTPFALIGLTEGLAEVTAGLSKGYFGGLSDRFRRRRAFVTLGYALSALSKPLPGLVPAWGMVTAARVLDRVGKGVRTGPRDALLAAAVPASMRGRAFGLHRALDTLGAAVGPALALVWLAAHPGDYRSLFLMAFVPALVGVVLTRFIAERRPPPPPADAAPPALGMRAFWRDAPPAYRLRVRWLAAFALVNASDVFLLLRVRGAVGAETSVGAWTISGDTATLAAYVLYNLVYALLAYPAGVLADRVGRRTALAAGLVVFAVVYAGMASARGIEAFAALFALYGAYAALTEGVAKAWIADVLPDAARGRGLGLFGAAGSLGALVASTLTGAVWESGPAVPLLVSAVGALVVATGVALGRDRSRESAHPTA